MFTILDYSSALEYSIIRRYTTIVYYYYNGDRCDLASTLCKYDFGKGDLFVLSWARV